MCCMLFEWKVIYHDWNRSFFFLCFTVCNNPYNLSVEKWETVPPLAYEYLTNQIGCTITEGHLLLVYAHRQSSHFGGGGEEKNNNEMVWVFNPLSVSLVSYSSFDEGSSAEWCEICKQPKQESVG